MNTQTFKKLWHDTVTFVLFISCVASFLVPPRLLLAYQTDIERLEWLPNGGVLIGTYLIELGFAYLMSHVIARREFKG